MVYHFTFAIYRFTFTYLPLFVSKFQFSSYANQNRRFC